ncbi:hypothetical protein ACFL0L_02920 [Patescibacteria group bacterium]
MSSRNTHVIPTRTKLEWSVAIFAVLGFAWWRMFTRYDDMMFVPLIATYAMMLISIGWLIRNSKLALLVTKWTVSISAVLTVTLVFIVVSPHDGAIVVDRNNSEIAAKVEGVTFINAFTQKIEVYSPVITSGKDGFVVAVSSKLDPVALHGQYGSPDTYRNHYVDIINDVWNGRPRTEPEILGVCTFVDLLRVRLASDSVDVHPRFSG